MRNNARLPEWGVGVEVAGAEKMCVGKSGKSETFQVSHTNNQHFYLHEEQLDFATCNCSFVLPRIHCCWLQDVKVRSGVGDGGGGGSNYVLVSNESGF